MLRNMDYCMIVTVCDLNGIKQYSVPRNSKKFLVLLVFIVVSVIAGLTYYIKKLSAEVSLVKEKNSVIEQKLQSKLLLQEQIKLANQKKQKELLEKQEKERQERLVWLKEEATRQEKEAKEKREQEALAKAKEEQKKLLNKKKAEEKQKARLAKLNNDKKQFLLNRQLPKIAKLKLGKRYVWGATGPVNFDCSGFTSYICKKKGIRIPRTAKQQSKYGKLIARNNLKPGDLLFFDTSRRSRGVVNHVGIYIGDSKFIHASSAQKKVVITSLNKVFYSNRFKWARRIDN